MVDISLSAGSGLDLLKELHARWPTLPLVVLTITQRTRLMTKLGLATNGELMRYAMQEGLAD